MTGLDADPRTHEAEAYERLRPLLFSIAYRMLASVAEAEDIVQDAFLRYHGALVDGSTRIESQKAYLSAITTRLAIDRLRSAQVRRESYIGEWMPEPLLTDETSPDAARIVEDGDSLSMAFLLMLERLSPVERSVFLLHDVFDYGYREVAEIIDKSEDNCRQLAVRARRHVHEHRPRFEPSREQRDQLASRFFDAVGQGDMKGLVDLLAADVVVVGDNGGTRPAWAQPIFGRDRVAPLLIGLGRHARDLEVRLQRAEINGQPGALYYAPSGELMYVIVLEVADGLIQAVRSVINPDKIRHLGPVADVRSMLHERSERRGVS
ncbi:MAG: RNA polymerase sigma-70 factor [Gaiellales bacterium]